MSEPAALAGQIASCRRCPRLVEWRERVAVEKRASYSGQEYWGRPVPGFGSMPASLLIVGLAPAAHGANRTGRMFTGDRSGEWLFEALHRAGFANQPTAVAADDGLELIDAFVTSAVHCAPPQNKPTADERAACLPWTVAEARLVDPAVVVALGALGFGAVRSLADPLGWGAPHSRPQFGHLAEFTFPTGPIVVASYHPSQQNTFTGRLTKPMFDAVFERARTLI